MKRLRGNKRARTVSIGFILVLALVFTLVPATAFASGAESETASGAESSSNYAGYWYKVKKGDALNKIARRNGTTVGALMRANGIHNKNRIYAGQWLYVPRAKWVSSGAGKYCKRSYVVKKGNTLSGIARYFGVSTKALKNANGIANANHIYAGQRLCIPKGGGYYVPKKPKYKGNWYLVKKGDTLAKISYWSGTSVRCLKAKNGIYNVNKIYAGTWLNISRCH